MEENPMITQAIKADNGQQIFIGFIGQEKSSVALTFDGELIYFDPVTWGGVAPLPPATMILVTHAHAESFAERIILGLCKQGTKIVTDPLTFERMSDRMKTITIVLSNDEKRTIGPKNIVVEALPAYGKRTETICDPQFPADNITKVVHPRGGNSYVVTLGEKTFCYLAGTEYISEMHELADRNIDVLFLPFNEHTIFNMTMLTEVYRAIKPKQYFLIGCKFEVSDEIELRQLTPEQIELEKQLAEQKAAGLIIRQRAEEEAKIQAKQNLGFKRLYELNVIFPVEENIEETKERLADLSEADWQGVVKEAREKAKMKREGTIEVVKQDDRNDLQAGW
jgi:L-ascorbate metabolism protein UlaG (beta-lactamase superfamily)